MDIQLKKIIKCEEELTSLFNEEQKALCENLRLEQSKLNSLTECKSFKNGIAFGVKLMTEVFADKDRVDE